MRVFGDSTQRRAILLSVLIHSFGLLFFFISFGIRETESSVEKLKPGSVLSVSLVSKGKIGDNSQSRESRSLGTDGTKTLDDEISEFQNRLSYPSLAFEQRLEDDCHYRVTVAENGTPKNVVVTKPCRYSVFDSQVKKQLVEWKFDTAKGMEIILPIRFRLDVKD
ncbi:MAG: TonB family protein [Leptospira sp.]|nr:TonB family protein [Leptospira sp.]